MSVRPDKNVKTRRCKPVFILCVHPLRTTKNTSPYTNPKLPSASSKKVFGPSKPTLNTFSEGTWRPRETKSITPVSDCTPRRPPSAVTARTRHVDGVVTAVTAVVRRRGAGEAMTSRSSKMIECILSPRWSANFSVKGRKKTVGREGAPATRWMERCLLMERRCRGPTDRSYDSICHAVHVAAM